MVAFLEKQFILNRNSYRASQAQGKLREIRRKAQGTPLADYINGIADIEIDVKFNMY